MNLLQSIGKTPLVRLAALNKGIDAEILVKIESRNPGGSIKDRAALRMIEGALERGVLRPKGTIVEPTSGNTGIGLAVATTCMGFRLILTMPESMSEERKALLRGFGAELILTPAAKGMGGAVEEAQRLAATKGYVLLDQFSNPDNAEAHYRTTGPEILADAGQVDAFVAGVGTGGTLTGIGRYLREHLPSVGLYAVEPAESAVLSGKPAGPHLIQGIGADSFQLLDRSLITEVLPIPGEEAIHTARRLMTERGISCGISSGANVAAALLLARRAGNEGQTHRYRSARHRRNGICPPSCSNSDYFVQLAIKRTVSSETVLFIHTEGALCEIRRIRKKDVSRPPIVKLTSMSAAKTPCCTRPGNLASTSSMNCPKQRFRHGGTGGQMK